MPDDLAGELFPVSRKENLETPKRYRDLKPRELLLELGLRPGERVVDLGAGTGFWTVAAASIVGKDGAVWAVDAQGGMITEVQRHSAEAGCTNVSEVKADATSTGLPDGIASTVIMGFMLHEVADKVGLLREARRLVGEDGKIINIDFDKKQHPDPEQDFGPPLEVRVDAIQLGRIAAAAGLTITKSVQVTPITYAVVMESKAE